MGFADDVRRSTVAANAAKRVAERSAKAKEAAAVRKARREGRDYAKTWLLERAKRDIKEAARKGEREHTVLIGDVTYEDGMFAGFKTADKVSMGRCESEQKALVKLLKAEGFDVTPVVKHGTSKWDNDSCPTESYIDYRIQIKW